MNGVSCLTTTLLIIRVVVGGWKKSLVLSIQIRVPQQFGHEVSFKGNDKSLFSSGSVNVNLFNNSTFQPQLKPNGVKLGLMAQSQRFSLYI